MTTDDLVDWYRQFDFDFKPGSNRTTMIRTPK